MSGAWIRIRTSPEDAWEYREVADDALQAALDWAHRKFGEPGAVLDIPDRLPEPKPRTPLLFPKRR
jgi:hypothetical protein